jgi:hypothetical protein
MLQFGGIPQKLIEDHLVKKAGRTGEEARLAAIFSEGSLGSALSFDSSGYKEIRAQALRFASLLLARRGFAELSMMSAGLAKQKESFPLWLAALAAVLQDLYYIGIAPERIGQRDILAELNQIAHTTSRAAVRSANEAVRRLQRGLLRNVNRQLALEALFLSQIDASADATGA